MKNNKNGNQTKIRLKPGTRIKHGVVIQNNRKCGYVNTLKGLFNEKVTLKRGNQEYYKISVTLI